jgi:hypothetical protein
MREGEDSDLAALDPSLVTHHRSLASQWHLRVSSPFTAAGPRGFYTLFPYPGVTNVEGTLGDEAKVVKFINVHRRRPCSYSARYAFRPIGKRSERPTISRPPPGIGLAHLCVWSTTRANKRRDT